MATKPEVPRASSPLANVVAAIVLAVVAALAVVIATNWANITTGLQDEVAAIPELEAALQQQQASGSESVLLVVMDQAGQVGALALLASADGQPSTLTVIPTSLFELLPGYGDFPLADAVGFEGPELAAVAVANALGVRVDRIGFLPSGVLGSVSSLRLALDLSGPVVEESDGPVDFQIADAGAAIYDAATVEQLLTGQFDSSPVGWLERQSAVWGALLDALQEDPTLANEILGDSPATAALNRVAANDPEVSVIPVNPVAVAGAEDGFQLMQSDVLAFVNDRLVHLSLAGSARPRVEVLNGNGELLATRSVVEALVAAGFQVIRTDNADNFEFEETVVISQGRENRDPAARAAAELGVRMVQLEVVAPSGVVDVSIIVGQDIATLRS